MDISSRLTLSYYQDLLPINEQHKIYLVRHRETNKVFIKKILDIYNIDVYAQLQHTPVCGIPQIIEFVEDDGQLIVIEEYISGNSLAELIENHSLSQDSIITYMTALCDILSVLHSFTPAIIHRDIKPSNIYITSSNQLFLLDFNAAKVSSDSDDRDTVLLGTHGYAAPEQYGFSASTPRTDIYSAGIVLKEMAASLSESTAKYDKIIGKATQMDPRARYKNASELKAALLSSSEAIGSAKSFSAPSSYLLPGYRTGRLRNIILGTLGYITVIYASLTLEVETGSAFLVWANRLTFFAIMMSIIFVCYNYRNIRRFFPFCLHRNRIIRYISIAVMNIVISFALIFVLILIENI